MGSPAESDVASVDKTRLEQASLTEFPESVDVSVYNAKTLNSLVTRMIVWNEVWSGLRHDPFWGSVGAKPKHHTNSLRPLAEIDFPDRMSPTTAEVRTSRLVWYSDAISPGSV